MLAGLAVAVAAVHIPHRPATLCLFRATTGVPCPLCGSTTAAVGIGRGDLLGALRAAPLTVLGAVTLTLAPLGPARVWWATTRRVRWLIVALALTMAEVWQLVRLGVVGS
ncbi:MAG: DUF2752 domain-containing protein [Actinomycetota bacterium]|nr:DUF2752 domain-containing protein [Actinomycetota bacterium]